jgi:DNA-binding response OmpR family regulator
MGSERGTDLLRDYSDQLFMSGAQVVMISGKAEYRDMCEDMGVDFFLEKPVAMRTLVTLANRLTARHSLSAAQRG